MEYLKAIVSLPEAARLEQLAEECAECGKEALKLARILRRENPTPKTEAETREALQTEIHDIMNCITVLDFSMTTDVTKLCRWARRLGVKDD